MQPQLTHILAIRPVRKHTKGPFPRVREGPILGRPRLRPGALSAGICKRTVEESHYYAHRIDNC